MYTDARARWFVRRADELTAADPDTVKSGLFNGNVPVPDPESGETVNVRRPLPVGEREPIAWRTCYREDEIYPALARRFTEHPRHLLRGGRRKASLLQRHETDVARLPPNGTALPERIADEMVDMWRRMQTIALRKPSGLMPPGLRPLPEEVRSRTPPWRCRGRPTKYRLLHLADLEATVGLVQLRLGRVSPRAQAHPRSGCSGSRGGVPHARRPAQTRPPGHAPEQRRHQGGHAFLWDPELVGWHDPHDALATFVDWGRSPADQAQHMVRQAQAVASPDVAANLPWNAARWKTFRQISPRSSWLRGWPINAR
ncbi:hypothetical protein ACU686_15820, partial [Yinghuangia aomiensis]